MNPPRLQASTYEEANTTHEGFIQNPEWRNQAGSGYSTAKQPGAAQEHSFSLHIARGLLGNSSYPQPSKNWALEMLPAEQPKDDSELPKRHWNRMEGSDMPCFFLSSLKFIAARTE